MLCIDVLRISSAGDVLASLLYEERISLQVGTSQFLAQMKVSVLNPKS